MRSFRDFKQITTHVVKSITITDAVDIFIYTDTLSAINNFEYIELPRLYELMPFEHYYVMDNFSHINGKKMFLTGELQIAIKADLISYISDCQDHDLAENMRFIDTELKGSVFCLNDDLDLIRFSEKKI